MCGIVGFVGREEAAPILLDGLSRLEYRGYDSAGIAVYGRREGLQVVKAKGVSRYSKIWYRGAGRSTGHWGWDTHAGPPTGSPQMSTPTPRSARAAGCGGAQRHHRELHGAAGVSPVGGDYLRLPDGYRGGGPTAGHYYDGDILDAVVKTLNRIQGAYALGIVCADCPAGSSPPGRTALSFWAMGRGPTIWPPT